MDDLLSEFLTETAESLAVIDVELVKFEQEPNNAEILQNIFRLVHTIKGTCGFLGLPRLESVAHAGENVLGKFRDGELDVTPEAVTLILRCIDTIRNLLGELEETGTEPEGDDSELIQELNDMADGKMHGAGGSAPAKPAEEEAPAPAEAAAGTSGGPVASEQGFPVAAELLNEVMEAQAQGVKAATDEEMAAENAAEAASAEEKAPAAEPAKEAAPESKPTPKAAVPAAPKAAAKKSAKGAGEKQPKESSVASQSIRVNVELLENLMTLVSELVLTRNQLLQMVRGHDDSEFNVPLQRLSHITSDLQEGVMKTRMQPIGNAWAKLPRIVRDLAVESGKKIELIMLGAETELDRQVLELIKDPLTHMVRNSADHGLETSADRVDAGKPEHGKITLNAFHEGGHIIIEISDDGRGLNMDRIRTKCVENGLATEAELDNMTDQQIQQFIFKAGFSTAEKVTSVSGRGVGMDVVRTNIEKIGGTIELKSIAGRGSTFTIKIPLTLAIVSALIIECAGERFAIPQISVLELVRASSESESSIEMINEAPVLRLRNRLLPLVQLRDLLKLEPKRPSGEGVEAGQPAIRENDLESADQAPPAEGDDTRVEGSDEVFIVVAQAGTYTFGIIVDRVFDTEEIVVKPPAPILRDIQFYSGNTILGDGSVIMILDPNGISAATGGSGTGHSEETASVHVGHQDEKSSMLIFRAGGNELKAVPLALVARLEEIDMENVESSHGKYVVQYRGQLMPLIPFNPDHEWKTEGRQPILVFTDHDRSMGLVVEEIVDITEENLKIELSSDVDGTIGSAVIATQATDVIDAGYFLTQAFSDWFGNNDPEFGAASVGQRVLLVDDSPFFRNLLRPILSAAGFTVTTVESAEDALRMREDGLSFDAIISDIEMPGMNGFDLAVEIRKDERWSHVPLVALSSHATDADFDRGREVGFNDYVAKFDREALVGTIAETVQMAQQSPSA